MYTTQKQVRAAFWEAHPDRNQFPKKKITSYDGKGKMYCTDTRCAFTDFVDWLSRDGQISHELAHKVTL